MGCCGQSRAAYSAAEEARYQPAATPPAASGRTAGTTTATTGGVRLHFTGEARVRVRGPVSGADYVFSGTDPVLTVATEDVEGLLRTGYFRRAY